MDADVLRTHGAESRGPDHWRLKQFTLQPPATVRLLVRSVASNRAKGIFSCQAPVPVYRQYASAIDAPSNDTAATCGADGHDATSADLVFINVQKPSKYQSVSVQSKIKAHAMRQVHQRRRDRGQSALRNQQTAGKCQCQRPLSHTTVPHAMYRDNVPLIKKHRRQLSGDGSRHPGPPRHLHQDPPGQTQDHNVVNLVCLLCGECKLLPQSDLSGPLSIQNCPQNGPSREPFNVFATFTSPVTHRVHELLHFCES